MLIGFFCAAACLIPLGAQPNSTYNPNSEGTIVRYGQPIGAYVDDEHPNKCAAARHWRFAVAGVSPTGGVRCATAVNAQEWYPFDCRYPAGAWGRIPAARAYILQYRFHWPGCRSPTLRQRERLLAEAERHHPSLILWY